MRTKKITVFALLCALAQVLGFFENALPVFNVIPGGKIGISNCVTMLVFCAFSFGETLIFGVLKGFLTAVLFSGLNSLLYSITGTVFSLAAMFITRKILKDKISSIGLSITGALFFNIGQLITAVFVLNSIHILRYFPVLGIVSAFSGVITGYISDRLKKLLN